MAVNRRNDLDYNSGDDWKDGSFFSGDERGENASLDVEENLLGQQNTDSDVSEDITYEPDEDEEENEGGGCKSDDVENVSEVSSTISTEEEQSMSVKSLLICGSSNDVEEENYTETHEDYSEEEHTSDNQSLIKEAWQDDNYNDKNEEDFSSAKNNNKRILSKRMTSSGRLEFNKVETSGYSSASATFLDEIANHLPKNIAKNRRNVSPYEMSIMDDSLKEFSRKRAKKELIVQEKLKYRNFSPRGIIAKRIEEAKLQWRKEKMNNLGVLQQKVQDLSEENKVLNRLVKRQSVTLDRLTSSHGELPSLIFAQNEEQRVIRHKMKQAQDYSRQLEEKLRARETEIQKLRETTSKTFTMATGGGSDTRNNSVISSRRQSRNSQSAQYANMELEDLKYELDEKEREINDLKHNLFVVKKSSRQQLNNEIGRHKASLKKLDEAMKTIDDLKNIIREKDKLINHTNIYAHRTLAQSLNRARRKSRLGSVSVSSSMMSLAPIINEDDDSNVQSLKHNSSNQELDGEFGFDENNEENNLTPEVNNEDSETSPVVVRQEIGKNKKNNRNTEPILKPIAKDLKKDEQTNSPVASIGKASKLERSRKSTEVSDDAAVAEDHDDEIHTKFMKRNMEIFDANEEESKQNDVFEGFYDDKLNCDEDVNDAEKKPKALGIKVERPRSFRSIKKFFEDSGTVIESKDYTKKITSNDEIESEEEKDSENFNNLKSELKLSPKKMLDENTKKDLLASLSAIDVNDDKQQQICNGISDPNDSYQPSFISNTNASPIKQRKETSVLFGLQSATTAENNPFANFKSLDSSANSIKSATSVDSERKAKLMKELFNYEAV